jgi:hypothetical protein
MSFINQTDFVGKFQLAENKFSDISPYINRYEDNILIELMGKDLADDFISDPTDIKWGLYEIKNLLVGLIYFEYVRDLPYRLTNKGFVYQMDENSSQVIHSLALRQRYNESIDLWKETQKKLRKEFDNFAGKKRKYMID